MQKCTIYHTGIDSIQDGVVKDDKVYFINKDNEMVVPEQIFLATEECEEGLMQFELNGKWGFTNIGTGEIVIEAVWDYAGPFYGGYAHVALGAKVDIRRGYYREITGGKHGYIYKDGAVVIPLEYDDAYDIPYQHRKYFEVEKNGKKGLIDSHNKQVIPLEWDYLETSYDHKLIFCAIYDKQLQTNTYESLRWGVYDAYFNLIVQPKLDQAPIRPRIKNRKYSYCDGYFGLRIWEQYGLISKDGSVIADIKLSKKEVNALLNKVAGRARKDLYL